MGLNSSSPKCNAIHTSVSNVITSNKGGMHKHATGSTKYKVAKTVKEQEIIEQMKYIEVKINKLMADQIELDKKQDKINR